MNHPEAHPESFPKSPSQAAYAVGMVAAAHNVSVREVVAAAEAGAADRSTARGTSTPDPARVAAYGEAIRSEWWVSGLDKTSAARAVLAVADAEQEALRAENERLRADVSEYDAALTRQEVLLDRTVNALRGDPPPHSLWSHHDVPELAAQAVTDVKHLLEDKATISALVTKNRARAEAAEAAVREWEDWSNELAMILPEDAETWPGVNPEGAQESIIESALRYLVAVEAKVRAVEALADEWWPADVPGMGSSDCAEELRAALAGVPAGRTEAFIELLPPDVGHNLRHYGPETAHVDGHECHCKPEPIPHAEVTSPAEPCPTPCDPDCDASCHEAHQVTWKRLREEVVQSASAVIVAVGGEVRVPFRLLMAAHEGRFTMTRRDDLRTLESVFRAVLADAPAEVTPPSEQRAEDEDAFFQCPHEAIRATCPLPCGCTCQRCSEAPRG